MLVVDGEDESIRWRDTPDALGQGGVQCPCILVHPAANEIDAFDAGYACLLKSRDPFRLVKAVRSPPPPPPPPQPAADISGQVATGRTGLRILLAEHNPIRQQIIAMLQQAGGR